MCGGERVGKRERGSAGGKRQEAGFRNQRIQGSGTAGNGKQETEKTITYYPG
jgi:hypothetical protein